MPKKIEPPAPAPVLKVASHPDESLESMVAQAAISPHLASALLIAKFGHATVGPVDLTEAVRHLATSAKDVRKADLGKVEAMLLSQATALNTIFASLATRASENMGQGQYMDAANKYMSLALRAQGQCRATLETLVAMKNPPAVFTRQANFAHGPQQINNGMGTTADPAHVHARENVNAPNGLLETSHGKRLDLGTPGKAGSGHPQLETVAALNRPAHAGGQG